MELLAEEERQDFLDVFSLLDRNNSETLELRELGPGLRSLGLNPTLREIKEIMIEHDKDDTNSLSREEFIGVYLKLLSQKQQNYEELKKEFEKLDVNQDGKITHVELTKVLRQGDEALTEEEIERVFEEFDANNDGFIELNEFLNKLLSN